MLLAVHQQVMLKDALPEGEQSMVGRYAPLGFQKSLKPRKSFSRSEVLAAGLFGFSLLRRLPPSAPRENGLTV